MAAFSPSQPPLPPPSTTPRQARAAFVIAFRISHCSSYGTPRSSIYQGAALHQVVALEEQRHDGEVAAGAAAEVDADGGQAVAGQQGEQRPDQSPTAAAAFSSSGRLGWCVLMTVRRRRSQRSQTSTSRASPTSPTNGAGSWPPSSMASSDQFTRTAGDSPVTGSTRTPWASAKSRCHHAFSSSSAST